DRRRAARAPLGPTLVPRRDGLRSAGPLAAAVRRNGAGRRARAPCRSGELLRLRQHRARLSARLLDDRRRPGPVSAADAGRGHGQARLSPARPDSLRAGAGGPGHTHLRRHRRAARGRLPRRVARDAQPRL
ncbi:MAG: hypothetical protein AVDCRST_MAG39-2777, partial [uncultured Sphingomonadaceae bacterium]